MFENIYQTNGAFKFNETLVVTLKKITMDDMIEFFTAYFNSILIFHGNLFAVEMRKESVTLNKPCYAGFCLLELTKIHMYDFYYNNLKKKYGDRAKLQFTDTDTLLLNIESEDIYEDMFADKFNYDFSDYDRKSEYYEKTNVKEIGNFKDETAGVLVTEFEGLKPKVYNNNG